MRADLSQARYDIKALEYDKEKQEDEWNRLDLEADLLKQQTQHLVHELITIGDPPLVAREK